MKDAKRSFLTKVARESKTNTKCFWKCVNSARKCKENISPLTKDNVNFATDDKSKADMLNNFFQVFLQSRMKKIFLI